jgi:hypothetical protein
MSVPTFLVAISCVLCSAAPAAQAGDGSCQTEYEAGLKAGLKQTGTVLFKKGYEAGVAAAAAGAGARRKRTAASEPTDTRIAATTNVVFRPNFSPIAEEVTYAFLFNGGTFCVCVC